MIRAHFGLQKNPFAAESLTLLAHQQEIFDILLVHAQQGGPLPRTRRTRHG